MCDAHVTASTRSSRPSASKPPDAISGSTWCGFAHERIVVGRSTSPHPATREPSARVTATWTRCVLSASPFRVTRDKRGLWHPRHTTGRGRRPRPDLDGPRMARGDARLGHRVARPGRAHAHGADRAAARAAVGDGAARTGKRGHRVVQGDGPGGGPRAGRDLDPGPRRARPNAAPPGCRPNAPGDADRRRRAAPARPRGAAARPEAVDGDAPRVRPPPARLPRARPPS